MYRTVFSFAMIPIAFVPIFGITQYMGQHSTSFTLSKPFQKFAAEQVESGRFASTSEVIRAGLRLLQEREAKLEALRAAIREGEESGPARPFDFDKFIEERFPNA